MSGRLIQMSGIVVDLVYAVETLPAPGGEVEAAGVLVAAGGGFNAMVAAKRAGAQVAYGGALGRGAFAEIAASAVEAENIPALQRQRKAMDQGNCVVLVDGAGERSFISCHGAERQIDIADLESVRPAYDDWVLVTGYGLYHPRSTSAMTAWLKGLPRGPLVLFDPGPMVSRIPSAALATALDRADWISANRAESEALTGLAEPSRSSRSLAAWRKGALVRVGHEGCWLGAAGAEGEHIPGFAVDAIDTTGAGDAHDGAFIAALLAGRSPRAAAVFANAAAAISTLTRGPATAPSLETIRAFLAARGADIGAEPEVRPPIAKSEAAFSSSV
jgi:sugar/nucleoside kinase (ribokinase family)